MIRITPTAVNDENDLFEIIDLIYETSTTN